MFIYLLIIYTILKNTYIFTNNYREEYVDGQIIQDKNQKNLKKSLNTLHKIVVLVSGVILSCSNPRTKKLRQKFSGTIIAISKWQ